jgi:hypothetical protein
MGTWERIAETVIGTKMELKKITVKPLVDTWSTMITEDPWTTIQKESLVDQMIAVSTLVTPYVVHDDTVSDQEQQSFLLFRTMQEIQKWLMWISEPYRKLKLKKRVHYGSVANTTKLEISSASIAQLEALPGIGNELAWEIAKFVGQRPNKVSVDDLIKINGIGPANVAQLKELTYIDSSPVHFLSPLLSAFVSKPGMESLLKLLDKSDLGYFYGDRSKFLNLSNGSTTSFERTTSFLSMIQEQTSRRNPQVLGVKTSCITAWANRKKVYGLTNAQFKAAKGAILLREAYMPFVKSQIETSNTSIYLMMFLGTLSVGNPEQLGPVELIKALETAAANGVDVRVILDQDDVGEPYKSLLINSPLVQRLLTTTVKVKFDKKDTLLHSKVLIIDKSKVVLGSHNWTFNSFYNTNELSIHFEQNETAEIYNNRFLELWNTLPSL